MATVGTLLPRRESLSKTMVKLLTDHNSEDFAEFLGQNGIRFESFLMVFQKSVYIYNSFKY